MALKKKERPLSPEELKQKLRKETSSRWLHGEPEFAFTMTPQGQVMLPLTEGMEKKLTLLFLLDAGDFLTSRVFEAIQIWRDRYKQLPWQTIVAVQQKYLFLKDPKFFDVFKTIKGFSTVPIYIDPFGELFEKYGSTKEPVLAMLNKTQLVYSTPLLPNFDQKLLESESTLQTQLRNQDPGLPLPLLYQYQIEAQVDKKVIKGNDFVLEGNWMDAGGAWMTNDPKAALTILFEGNHLRCISTLHPQARNPCRLPFTLNGAALNQNIAGESVRYDENGHSLIEVSSSQGIFDLIEAKEKQKGLVKIQMTHAEQNPIIFYEARFA